MNMITMNINGKEFRTFYPNYPVIRAPWKIVKNDVDIVWFRNNKGLLVALSGHELDGKKWIHVSFSRKSRMPEYTDIKLVKQTFIGDKKAIMVFPEEKHFVNIHPYCLHFYHCVDGDGLPEFSQGLGVI